MPHITFIHGISNMPPQDKLLRRWRDALKREDGIDLGAKGVSCSMVYWADVLYAEPAPDEQTYESAALAESPDLAIKSTDPPFDMAWRDNLTGSEQAWVERLAGKLNFDAEMDEQIMPPEESIGPQFERIPLPGFVKKRLMKTFLRDVHHYLFNIEYSLCEGKSCKVRDEVRKRMLDALWVGAKKPGPHIIVSHSMGTVIAYDCLKRVPECPRVDALITLGSPLGLDEIQDGLAPGYSRQDGFPSTTLAGRWINVFDQNDPVICLDRLFAKDYQKSGVEVVEDIHEPNWGLWRHDVTKYLKGKQFRARLLELLKK